MCGRYTLTAPVEVVTEIFQTEEAYEFQPRYNIAPSQPVSAIAQTSAQREYRLFQWGLVPSWAKDPAIGNIA